MTTTNPFPGFPVGGTTVPLPASMLTQVVPHIQDVAELLVTLFATAAAQRQRRFPRLVESRYDQAFVYLRSHCSKRSLVILISNLIDEVNAHQVQTYLSTLVGRHLPLGVLIRDHSLFDAAENTARDEEEVYRAAAAAEILAWRHHVLMDLERKGVLALDVFPEDMTAPLVNRYLEIKARHLL